MYMSLTFKAMSGLSKAVFLALVTFSIAGCGVIGKKSAQVPDYNGVVLAHSYYGNQIYPYYSNPVSNSFLSRVKQGFSSFIGLGSVSHYDVVVQQSRAFYLDEPLFVVPHGIDGTVRQINVTERNSGRVPVCRTVIQSVSGPYHNSFQYVGCQ